MKSTVLALVLLFTAFISSCSKETDDKNTDKCESVMCMNNGVCVDGECDCPEVFKGINCQTAIVCDDGFEGPNCDMEVRAKFLGIYLADAVCEDGGSSNINIIISAAAANMRDIWISEETMSLHFLATVDSSNHISINQDDIGGGQSMVGEGTINDNTITLNYVIGGTNTCSATLVKQ